MSDYPVFITDDKTIYRANVLISSSPERTFEPCVELYRNAHLDATHTFLTPENALALGEQLIEAALKAQERIEQNLENQV